MPRPFTQCSRRDPSHSVGGPAFSQIDPAQIVDLDSGSTIRHREYFLQKEKDCFSMTHIWCNNSPLEIKGGFRSLNWEVFEGGAVYVD
jgi:hypothetical protein